MALGSDLGAPLAWKLYRKHLPTDKKIENTKEIANAESRGQGLGRSSGDGNAASQNPANIANGPRLQKQLTTESARSSYTIDGKLTTEAIKDSTQIQGLGPGQLANKNIPPGYGKYQTSTFQSPSGDYKVHFYRNPQTGHVLYNRDYKAVFNSMSGVPRK
ncbi:MAG: hypothetical protein AAGD15_21015 [Agrobacterium cavarae]|uniref:hypothetical protein n=1 Tax=Agrobacterium cavarae TaxID=2528239 RepID=UPI0031A508F7